MIIDKGIPVPDLPSPAYRWHDMEVGDSFYAETSPRNLRAAAYWQANRYNRKYIVRKEGTGARVWRVA